MNMKRVAVIDEDKRTRDFLELQLKGKNYETVTADSYHEAKTNFDLNEADYVITDLRNGMLEPGTTNIESTTILYSTLDPDQIAEEGFDVTGDGSSFERVQENPPVFYAIRNYVEFDEIEEILDDEWRETNKEKPSI